MYNDDDPHLADVRRLCLALPESVEIEAWGRPTFRAGKMFCVYSGTDEHPNAIILQADDDERPALLEDPRFFLAPYWRGAPWISYDLDATLLDWQEVAELLDTSYRRVALKRMVKQLDEGGPFAR